MTLTPCCFALLLLCASGRHIGFARAQEQATAFDPPPYAPCRTCAAQPGFLNVTTAPYTVANFACASPLYVPVILATCDTTQLDSVCFTYFYIDHVSYLVVKAKTYACGDIKIEVYIAYSLEESPGSHRLQGLTSDSGCSTLLSQLCVLGAACENTYVIYETDYYRGVDRPPDTTQDLRYVLSSSPTLDPCCINRVQAIFTSRSFCGDDFHYMPYQYEPKCVALFNGAQCINYDRLKDSQKLALPLDSLSIPGGQQQQYNYNSSEYCPTSLE